ncbi:MAG: hypothetical protein FD146_1737 [Anaerolineaceae bacterium]|nr:MAG: hypothetical protein FD146_1737 [Anaerolineaceae bacterium]
MGNSPSKKLKFWPLVFLLAIVEGALSLASLLLIPREMESGVLFGFSRTRLAIMAALLAALVVLAVLAWLSWRRPDWRLRWLDPAHRPRLYAWLHAAFAAGTLAAGFGLFWLRYWDPERLATLFVRARPPLVFALLVCAQLALWLLFLRTEPRADALRPRRGVYAAGLVVFAAFLTAAVFVALTGLGVTPDTGWWSEPGVPLLGWQVVLAVIGGWLILMLGLNEWIAKHGRLFDLFLGAALWGLAFVVWTNVPLTVLKDSFYAPIQPPYTVPFPYSDAGLYDSSSRMLLLGNGFGRLIPPRPLYIVFLAGLHAVFGNSYAQTVLGQTLALALFPVALYFLGKKFHSRAAGLTVGLLAIFRELTTLWVSSATRVSNSKMFLSDLPNALAAAAFLLLAVGWLSKKERRPFDAFLAGGLFGLLLLLRTQMVFTLGALALAGLFAARCPWRRWLAGAAVFAAGMLLALAPWLARNWAVTGGPSLDDPAQVQMIASLYAAGTPDYTNQGFENMTPAEAVKTVVGVIVHQPGHVARFVTNHFLANEIGALLVLPLVEDFEGLNAPVNLYWLSWDGSLTWQNALVILLYLALMAVGIGAAWKRLGWAGLLPLLFNLFYALSNAVARVSGWRYILPMDWAGYFYFGLGVMELLAGLALIFGGGDSRLFSAPGADPRPAAPKRARFPVRAAGAAALIVLVGSLPVILERAVPPHFPASAPDALAAQLSASPAARSAGVDDAAIQEFLAQPDAVVVTGQLVYPRFFGPGWDLRSANPWPAYARRDYAHMGFLLLAPEGVFHAVLPVESIPQNFPPDQDVILLGYDRGDYLDVRLLLFLSGDTTFSGGSLAEGCGVR